MRHEAAAAQGKGSQKANFEALEARLDALMKTVRLSYLIQREGGWDAVASWGDTLSLGEQQRMGLVRLSCYIQPGLQSCCSALLRSNM